MRLNYYVMGDTNFAKSSSVKQLLKICIFINKVLIFNLMRFF